MTTGRLAQAFCMSPTRHETRATIVSHPAIAPQYNTEAGMVSAFISHRHNNWRGDLRFYYNKGEGNWLHQAALDGDTLTNF